MVAVSMDISTPSAWQPRPERADGAAWAYIAPIFQGSSRHRQSANATADRCSGAITKDFPYLDYHLGIKAARPAADPGGFYLAPSGCVHDRVHFGWCRD